MSRPAKKSARERLLEHCDEQVARTDRLMEVSWSKVLNAKTRRLLRAHERELAERAVANMRERGMATHPIHDNAIRAAILGPRGKRGGR